MYCGLETERTQILLHYHPSKMSISTLSLKISIYILMFCVILFILLQIQTLQSAHWKKLLASSDCTSTMTSKLQDSISFLPLKDLRFSRTAMEGHTWFMSSMNDTQEEGEVVYQEYPSRASKGRLLCIRGHNRSDGSFNYYALAWPESLPHNSITLEGLTFISENHYDYINLWHGLSNLGPFARWHIKNQCEEPKRWILYHWGEIRTQVAPWLKNIMEATYGGRFEVETLDGLNGDGPVCFEKAVVMRHDGGGLSREKRIEMFDLLRYKARRKCNVSLKGNDDKKGMSIIGLTLLMREGGRSFKNESIVKKIFDEECKLVQGCKLMVAHSDNLTFCDQVKLMSMTDILVTPHGAQLTNLIFMDKKSSIMELFPKGWLEFAGAGQYVFHWMADWSDMKHQGTWRDPQGDPCPYKQDTERCMTFYKNGRIGYNQTLFSSWAKSVLNEVKIRKITETVSRNGTGDFDSSNNFCVGKN